MKIRFKISKNVPNYENLMFHFEKIGFKNFEKSSKFENIIRFTKKYQKARVLGSRGPGRTRDPEPDEFATTNYSVITNSVKRRLPIHRKIPSTKLSWLCSTISGFHPDKCTRFGCKF